MNVALSMNQLAIAAICQWLFFVLLWLRVVELEKKLAARQAGKEGQ